ncbi:MAG: mechanosensitive ion channel [Gammaproteobacteria bacterium]|nr:mechanosensitive ion channel [Gammaproteobacteria bacterium]
MPEFNSISRILSCVFILSMLFSSVSLGAEQVAEGGNGTPQIPDIAQLEAKIKELSAIAEPDTESARELEFYQSALTHLKASQRDEAAVERYKQTIDEAADQKANLDIALRKALDAGREYLPVVDDLNLVQLERKLDQARANRKLAENKLAELQARISNERLRPGQITEAVANIELRLQEIDKELEALELADQELSGLEARFVALLVRQQALRSNMNRLEMERLSYSPRNENLKAQIELRQQEFKQSGAQVQYLQELLTSQRTEEAREALELAERAARESRGKHPLIQTAAEEITDLSEKLDRLTVRLEQAVADKQQRSGELQRMTRNLEIAKKQLDVIRLDESIGKLLRSERKRLPDLNLLEDETEQARDLLAEVHLEQFRVEDDRLLMLDRIEGKWEEPIEKPGDLDDRTWQLLRQELDTLNQNRFSLLEQLLAAYARYEQVLSDTESVRAQLMFKVEEYGELLDRSMIWIPSSKRLDLEVAGEVVIEFISVLATENWGQIFRGDFSRFTERPLAMGVLVFLLTCLFAFRGRMRLALEMMVSDIGDVTLDRFSLTLEALLLTVFLAIPWVFMLLALGWMFRAEPSPIGDILSPLLTHAGYLLGLIQLSRYLFITNGLAEVHFSWNRDANALFRRHLRWFMGFTVIMMTLLGSVMVEGSLDFRDSLGRLVLMSWFLGLWWLAHLFLNPWTGAEARRKKGENITFSWRSVAYLVVMGLMLFLTVLQFEGYVYTVDRLLVRIGQSVYTAMLVLVLFHLARRWMLVAGRRLRYARTLEKRQAELDARAAREAAGAAGESVLEIADMGEMDLSEIGEQTSRLMSVVSVLLLFVALGFLWLDLTPAIIHLDEVVLWEHMVDSGGIKESIPVSVWDLGTNLLVIILTLVAARNLPGLLEISLMQPLDLDPGARYTISKISSYVVYALGTWLALTTLGLRWGDIQWLVAAMGVGLGFGLQEIFANFISGLIILFERPIRIGDTVTIGQISGTVSRIRIRATTVTDWDNKELIVPNKSFVTDSLINWTLSEDITRIVIPVGIAYGSDTEKVHRVMMEVVKAHPNVLEEPPPTVFFLGFGESALDFSIRVFVKERLGRMPLTHDLHMALDKALREAGIEIPFPQRDLHLRTGHVEMGLKGAD